MRFALYLLRGLGDTVFPYDTGIMPYMSFSDINGLLFPGKSGITRFSQTNHTDLARIMYTLLGMNERNYCGDPVFMTSYCSGEPVVGDVCIECSFGSIRYSDEEDTEYIERCSDLSDEEFSELFEYVSQRMSNSVFEFVSSDSGRGYIIWNKGDTRGTGLMPLADDSLVYSDAMPHGEFSEPFINMINTSRELLYDCPVNIRLRQQGRKEASVLWFGNAGTVPEIPHFSDVFGMTASVYTTDKTAEGLCRSAGIDVVSCISDCSSDILIYDADLSGKKSEITSSDIIDLLSSGVSHDTERIMISSLPSVISDAEVELCPPMPFVLFDRKLDRADNEFRFPPDAYGSGLYIPDAYQLLKLLIA